jgi:hypothetical protein
MHSDGCNARCAGSYLYEHNPDGGGAWSFSLSMLALSISYGNSGVHSLQKAATYSYYG